MRSQLQAMAPGLRLVVVAVVVVVVVVVVFVIVVVAFWFVIGRFFTNLSCHAVAAGRDS